MAETALFASTPVTPSVEFVTAPTTGNSAALVITEAGPRSDGREKGGSGASSGALIGGVVGGVVGGAAVVGVAAWVVKSKLSQKKEAKSSGAKAASQVTADKDVYVNNPLRQLPSSLP